MFLRIEMGVTIPHSAGLLEELVVTTQNHDIAGVRPGTKVIKELPGTFWHLPLVGGCQAIMLS